MPIYKLGPKGDCYNDLDYDCNFGFVIRAKNHKEARQTAHNRDIGDEDPLL